MADGISTGPELRGRHRGFGRHGARRRAGLAQPPRCVPVRRGGLGKTCQLHLLACLERRLRRGPSRALVDGDPVAALDDAAQAGEAAIAVLLGRRRCGAWRRRSGRRRRSSSTWLAISAANCRCQGSCRAVPIPRASRSRRGGKRRNSRQAEFGGVAPNRRRAGRAGGGKLANPAERACRRFRRQARVCGDGSRAAFAAARRAMAMNASRCGSAAVAGAPGCGA